MLRLIQRPTGPSGKSSRASSLPTLRKNRRERRVRSRFSRLAARVSRKKERIAAATPATTSGYGTRSAANGRRARPNRKSPVMPPSDVARTQLFGIGQEARQVLAARTLRKPSPQLDADGLPISSIRFSPAAKTRNAPSMPPQPRIWLARSATTAPVMPKRLLTSLPVAAFRLGSCGS